MLIEDVVPFAEAAIERLDPLYETYPCPQCGCGVNFPRVASRKDIDDFANILEVAEKYLSDNRVMDKIIAELMDRISALRREQHLKIVK